MAIAQNGTVFKQGMTLIAICHPEPKAKDLFVTPLRRPFGLTASG